MNLFLFFGKIKIQKKKVKKLQNFSITNSKYQEILKFLEKFNKKKKIIKEM